MKVGDLIQCTWQPLSSGAGHIEGVSCVLPMHHHIKGEYGIIVDQCLDIDHHTILFPKFGYEHTLSSGAFDVMKEGNL